VKISTKLFVGILFLLGSILMLGFILFLTNTQVNQASEKRNRAEEIVAVVFERNLLLNEFVRKGGERVTSQLQVRSTSIGEVLRKANQQFIGGAEKNVLISIEQDHDDTTLALGRLIESYTVHGLIGLSTIESELRERLINQILIESQVTVNSVAELAELARETVIRAQRQAQIAILVFIFFLIAIAGVGLILVNRSITRPMNYFLSVVQTIAGGDLSKRAEVTSKDEIGQLATAFNDMTSKLETSYRGLEHAKAKDEAILESIGDGLIVTDKKRGIVLVNKAALRILALSPKELIGSRWPEVISIKTEKEKIVPLDEIPIQAALVSGTTTTTADYTYTRKDGVIFPVVITASPVRLGGEIAGAVVVFRDITKEKEVERVRTELVGFASHRLRMPLTSLNWSTEMLLSGEVGMLEPKQKKYMDKINASAERMTNLVGQLLDVSRIDLGTMVNNPLPTQLSSIADETIEKFKKLAEEKKLMVTKRYEKDLPEVFVDQTLIRTAFKYVFSNAVRYTPEGGSVSLEITKEPEGVRITIRDTGYGIPKQEQGQIFQRLFRAKNIQLKDADGTGLGLFITKAIVDLYGGRIWFESEESKGTTFYISIPLGRKL